MVPPWFERAEYSSVRKVVCLAGHEYHSQARGIEFMDKVNGELRPVVGKLAKTPCPSCGRHRLLTIKLA